MLRSARSSRIARPGGRDLAAVHSLKVGLSPEKIRELLRWDAKPPAEKAQITKAKRADDAATLSAVKRDRAEALRQRDELSERWETLKGAYRELDAAVDDALALLEPEHPAAKRLRELR
jgi:DNA-binding transcriptional MerR regulator